MKPAKQRKFVATEELPSPDPLPTDQLGNKLPERIGKIFADDGKLRDLQRQVRKLKESIIKMMDEHVGVYLIPARKAIEADCNNLASEIKFALPYAICPSCGGDGCKACMDVGWMPKAHYERLPK